VEGVQAPVEGMLESKDKQGFGGGDWSAEAEAGFERAKEKNLRQGKSGGLCSTDRERRVCNNYDGTRGSSKRG